jgi:30S ribosomal protein 3
MKSGNLRLKVIWLKNCLGLAIDQVSLQNQLPITFYHFWPRTETWEQLKLELDCKPWLSDTDKVKLLNTAGKIMDFWQTSKETTTAEDVIKNFDGIVLVKFNNN